MNELIMQKEQVQQDILTSLIYRAFVYDKEMIEKDLEKREEEVRKDTSFLAGLKNTFRNNKIGEIKVDLARINKEIEKTTYGKTIDQYNLYYQTHLGQFIQDFYQDDKYDVLKSLLAIQFIIMTNKKFVNEIAVHRHISNIIFNDNFRLRNLKHSLEGHYQFLAKKQLTDDQKKLLMGVGIASIAALVVTPILFVGGAAAGASVTTAALATVGFADMQIGVGMLALYGFLVGASIAGGTYIGLRLYNNEQTKKEYEELCKQEFKKTSIEEAKMFLAIKLTIVEQLKSRMPKEEFKEYLSETLEIIDSLREDNTYLLLVERKESEDTANKMEAFHRFDNRLLSIVK